MIDRRSEKTHTSLRREVNKYTAHTKKAINFHKKAFIYINKREGSVDDNYALYITIQRFPNWADARIFPSVSISYRLECLIDSLERERKSFNRNNTVRLFVS